MNGTLGLIRLYLRKDRVVLPLWIVVIGLNPLLYAVSFDGLYPTAQDRDTFYAATMRIPAQLMLIGPIFGSDLGALVTWRSGILLTLAPLAVVLTVVRHSRGEEDAGRTELIGSTAVGRQAGLAAAIAVAVGGVVAAGALAATTLLAFGLPATGSVAFGLSIAAVGIVFAGVAAVAAQVASGARVARGYALSVLAAAFTVRAVGDAGSGTLSWLSPIGWSSQLRPFADERWWVLVLPVVAASVSIAAGFALAGRRDLGSGLIAERLGPPSAPASLQGVFGLAWRGHRGAFFAWAAGMGIVALVMGAAADGVGAQLEGSAAIGDALATFGGTTLVQSYIAGAISVLGIGAAAYSISAFLRAHAEEEASITEPVLATSVGRVRWVLSHLFWAAVGPAVVMTVVGLTAGLAYGIAVGRPEAMLPEVLGAALAQVPAVWVITATAVLLFGIAPRYAATVWGVLVACVFLGQVGAVIGFPQIVLDLSPFTHVPHLPGGAVTPVPLVVSTVVAVLACVVGVAAFRRRDIRS